VTDDSPRSSTGATPHSAIRLDYSWLVHELYPEWDLEPDLRRRAQFYYRLAPFYSVHYGVFRKQPEYAAKALVTVRERLGATPRP
jgi:hypothetical protein